MTHSTDALRDPADDAAASADGAELRSGIRLVLLAVSVAVLAVALPAALLADVPAAPRSDGWIVTLIIMIWAGVRISLLWVSGIPRLFDYFLWLFTYIFMGIAPTAQILSGLTSTTTPGVDAGLDLPTAGIVALGLVCYEVGRLGWMLWEGGRAGRAEPRVLPVHPTRAILLAMAGALLSAYYVSRIGFAGSLGSREGALAARQAAWPDPAMRSIFYASAVYPLLVATGALAQLTRTARSRTNRRWALGGAIAAVVLVLLVVNPVASARYTFGTTAFALAVFAGAVATTARARITMLSGIVGFLALFPLADAFRTADGTATRTGFFEEYLSNPDYDAFWQIANALSYWIDGLVMPGRQAMGSLLFFVPRAIWPDKPTDTGITLAEYRGYSFDNLSAPMWAEALVNGGIIAVVIVFAALGVALRAMDTRMVPAFATGGVWAIAGAILPVYMTILLRGSLLQATGALAITIVSVLLVAGRDREAAAPDYTRSAPM
ncbi:hypothetical protein [Microbacterium sp. YJN-G]|uniref:hypothetical protein n=1 Tax=Microbacterium sp. YJN-G TaxID=2763257 RepID=UPI001878804D|nr:hypothetical protein [Microbacterium sp. YJN-G]